MAGDVRTEGGDIALQTGTGAAMTLASSARVQADSGSITLAANAINNHGLVQTATGNIHLSASSVGGAGTFSAPGGQVTGMPVICRRCRSVWPIGRWLVACLCSTQR